MELCWACAWGSVETETEENRNIGRVELVMGIGVHNICVPRFFSNNSWKRWYPPVECRIYKTPVIQANFSSRATLCLHWKSSEASYPDLSPLWFSKVLRNPQSTSGNCFDLIHWFVSILLNLFLFWGQFSQTLWSKIINAYS